MRVVSVTRPTKSTIPKDLKSYFDLIESPKTEKKRVRVFEEGIFTRLLERRVRATNRRTSASNPWSDWGSGREAFTHKIYDANTKTERWLSYFFVWPAGIVENNRESDALNKIQYVEMKHRINAQAKTNAAHGEFNTWRHGPEERARRLLAARTHLATPILKKYIRDMRTMRSRYKRVIGEMRVTPQGTVVRSFPGGAEYHASIARLKNMARLNTMARENDDTKKRKRSNDVITM
jgi:hypothetical protein